ncbi:LysR family transcriptional regulator [Methylobacterium longum]|jgi:DNA-binding transcriptional LysR family regulator|uniref:LysR family transcriptional regulator n=1 Tax=Methylobacterium longum TaxID=767694 RepID=A0ABT8AVR3_9HYPH|nr:LysR family transcriptional regulator [Methylobacterium longum]MDN3574037.1 LysR family transcriptional regulator [Methylobacterium longum]GJE11924.1 Hca operon transcriptional activator HcaR [Methylobacterium longum]
MARTLDVDLLRSFAVVAETAALSRAAERVGRSQAALSMQMKRLEELVGRPLLTRTGRGVLLTVQGERLLVHARRILASHDDALAEFSGGTLSGSLRFGCPDDYAQAFLPTLLRGFAQHHPAAAIEVVCAATPRLEGRLERGGLDLALVSVPIAAERAILRREELVWVLPKGGTVTRPDPLPLALGDPDTLDHRAALAALDGAGRAYRIAYASGSLSGLLAVVRSGQAVAVLTRSAVPPDLRIQGRGSGLPSLPRIGLTLRLDERHASPLTRAFAAHLRTVLPAL